MNNLRLFVIFLLLVESSAWFARRKERLSQNPAVIGVANNSATSGGIDDCFRFRACFQTPAVDMLNKLIEPFNFKDIYPNISQICAPRKTAAECMKLDPFCPLREVYEASLMDKAIDWVCYNSTGFRDAAPCFKDPLFQSELHACDQHYERPGNKTVARFKTFRCCVENNVEGLNSCNKIGADQFFLSFFHFVADNDEKLDLMKFPDDNGKCLPFNRCFFAPAVQIFDKITGGFNFMDVHQNIAQICTPRKNVTECLKLDPSCSDKRLISRALHTDKAMNWTCQNAAGFREAAPCLEDPSLQTELHACNHHYERPGNKTAARFKTLHCCVRNSVESLKTCTSKGTDKFFLSFFSLAAVNAERKLDFWPY